MGPLGTEYRGVNVNPHLKVRAGRVRIPGLAAKLLALVSHLYRHSFYVGYHLFLVLIYSSNAAGIVSDSFDAGVENRNVAVGKSLSMWCGLRHGVPGSQM